MPPQAGLSQPDSQAEEKNVRKGKYYSEEKWEEREREKNTQYKSWKRKKKASLTDFSREKKMGQRGD